MGGVACAKTIIDQGNAVTQQLGCMNATIQLAASGAPQRYPSEELETEFVEAANAFAKVCSKVERYCRTGSAAPPPVAASERPPET